MTATRNAPSPSPDLAAFSDFAAAVAWPATPAPASAASTAESLMKSRRFRKLIADSPRLEAKNGWRDERGLFPLYTRQNAGQSFLWIFAREEPRSAVNYL